MEHPTPRQIADAVSVTEAYARMLVAGTRKPSLEKALALYDALGVKMGPIENLTDSQINVARKMVA